jgi:hypothetical protein
MSLGATTMMMMMTTRARRTKLAPSTLLLEYPKPSSPTRRSDIHLSQQWSGHRQLYIAAKRCVAAHRLSRWSHIWGCDLYCSYVCMYIHTTPLAAAVYIHPSSAASPKIGLSAPPSAAAALWKETLLRETQNLTAAWLVYRSVGIPFWGRFARLLDMCVPWSVKGEGCEM